MFFTFQMNMRLTLGLLVLLLYLNKAFSQDIDNPFNQTPSFPHEYMEAFDSNVPMFNGRVFSGYPPNYTGTSFFLDIIKTKGSVIYDSILYKDLFLTYDVYTDNVIVRSDKFLPFILYNERVSGFTLDSLKFLRITDRGSENGFYQVVQNGALLLLAKRQKILNENLEQNKVLIDFLRKDKFYIIKDDQWYPVSSKRALYKLLKEKRRPIVKKIKQKDIFFNKNREEFITTAVQLFNKL